MVTKRKDVDKLQYQSSVLAKILMVTKQTWMYMNLSPCSVLAKILMVTKPRHSLFCGVSGSVLAKILMVTKQF